LRVTEQPAPLPSGNPDEQGHEQRPIGLRQEKQAGHTSASKTSAVMMRVLSIRISGQLLAGPPEASLALLVGLNGQVEFGAYQIPATA
jgi:hypothetical protein